MNGSVVHFEIPFDDGDRARAFYSGVFGWRTQEMPEMQYTMVTTGPVDESGMPTEPGFINGGMFARQDTVNVPTVTINVDSIDETLPKVEAGGGSIVEGKMPVGDMGSVAYIKDSEGNLVGLWQNA